MRIDIAGIMSKTDGVIKENFNLETDNISFCGSKYVVDTLDNAYVEIVNLGRRSISVSMTADINLQSSCSRCLKKVLIPINISFNEEIKISDLGKGIDTDNDSVDYIDEFMLDTDSLLLNEIYPRIPSSVLCSDDCKGLCMVCGKNLNEGNCTCDTKVLDPRMAKILDVFNNFKEV